MEQELRFGLDLGWLAILKKRVWADYEQLLRIDWWFRLQESVKYYSEGWGNE